jgi:pilus assembly protein Flp/PilA
MLGIGPFCRLRRCEDGVTSIEYGLISALVAVVIIAAVSSVGNELDWTFSYLANSFSTSQDSDFPDPCQKGGDNCGN